MGFVQRDSPLVALGLAHVAHWLSAAALPFAESDGELVEVFSPPRGSSNAEVLRPSELRPTAAGDLLQPALDAFAAKSSMVMNSLHRWDATAGAHHPIIGSPAYSDLLRTELLYVHGGLWVVATLDGGMIA